MALTDERWAALEPLVEVARPKGKTPPRDLRRTIAAIAWRHRNGARWRAIPAEFGPWWRAAQLFIRWSKRRTWERLLGLARGVELGMAFVDGSVIRAHAKAAGASKRGRARGSGTAAGRSGARAAGSGKACVVADGNGRAVAFALAPGHAHELPLTPALLDRLPRSPLWVVGDRGYSSHQLRERIRGSGARPAIPTRSNEAEVACPGYIYRNRNLVERLWSRLKEWRAVATRYEKTKASFHGVLCLAATADWLKN